MKVIDTDTALEEEPMQVKSRNVAREFKSGDRPDLYVGDSSLRGFEVDPIDGSEPLADVWNTTHGCVSSIFPRQGSKTSAGAFVGGPGC